MPWNPSPQVAAARDAAKALGADRVVIVFTTPEGRFGYASFGRDKALCANARKLGDRLYEEVERFFAEGEADAD
jgi:hypothetical protein